MNNFTTTDTRKEPAASPDPVRSLTRIALATAVLCILGPLSIPIGPVPISLTILVVCLSVYILGTKKGMISCLLYILLGLAGLPVFSGFQGGPGKLFGVTGGYIFGFLFLALIAGIFVEHFPGNIFLHLVGMLLGTAICYLFGTIWFVFLAKCDIAYAMTVCVLPFIPADLVKIALAVSVGPLIQKRLIRAGLLDKQ